MLVLSEYRKKSVTLKTVSQILNNEQPLLCVSLKVPPENVGNGGKWEEQRWEMAEERILFFIFLFLFFLYTLEWEEEDLNKIANRKFYFAFSQIFSVFDVF